MTDQVRRLPTDLAHFEEILQHLHQVRGFDFTAYKRASLLRRVTKRMEAVGIESFEAYYDYLQLHQDEFDALFNTILINVTSFFRDREVWTYMGEQVLPALLEDRKRETVRVWSAGCSSGHEPYTIAMLLAEHVGSAALRERVKIYATDVDEEALAEARAAVYSARYLDDVPAAMVAKYFDRNGSEYTVNRDLRRAVIFGRHDLVQDAPISRIDLLVCRNTLMYFHADAQSRILARFYFAVNPGGYVMLGRAEMLFSHAAMFTAQDLKRRVFQTVPKPDHRDRLLLLAQTGRDIMPNNPTNVTRLREAAFESDGVPQIVLDLSGTLAAANGPARAQFGLSERDIGCPIQDLEVSYRPIELRASIGRVLEEDREIVLKDVFLATGSDSRYFDITVAPLRDEDGALVGTRISFRDVTDFKALQEQLQHSKQELETAYEELQSTNEELETMNEELQSTNEELQTMNDELRNRSLDLNSANAFLQSVFVSLRWAVIVLDRDYAVHIWNDRATDMWGLRPEEAHGKHFLSLDIGLPVAELRPAISEVLGGHGKMSEVVVRATNRRGKAIQCRVSAAPLRYGDSAVRGVILLMEETEGAGDAPQKAS
jgi:two-component system, chemotaxis family, CheB/CheR fusion protein